MALRPRPLAFGLRPLIDSSSDSSPTRLPNRLEHQPRATPGLVGERYSWYTRTSDPRSSVYVPDQPYIRARPSRGKAEARPGEARPGQAEPGEAGRGQAEPGQGQT